ncbi:MAG: tetratricopeptide repeat protein, partial [Chloroflexota bacterium]
GSSLGVGTLPLDVLGRDESVSLLLKFRPDLEKTILDQVADELGDLPLALHMAGNYLKKYRRSIRPEEYLLRLKDPQLLDHLSMQAQGNEVLSPTGHIQHIGRTFAMSYDQLDLAHEKDALAHKLLVHAAHFAPGEPIWYQLLVKTLQLPHHEKTEAFAEEAFSRLIELGLIEVAKGNDLKEASNFLHMHRLVAKFVRDVARQDVKETQLTVEEVVFEETAAANASGYPVPLLSWQFHLRSVVNIAQAREDLSSASLCAELAEHLREINDHAGALKYAKKALDIRSKLLSESDELVTDSLRQIGHILIRTELRKEDSLNRLHQALAIEKKREHVDPFRLAQSLNLIGFWHITQNQTQDGINYYEDAVLAISATDSKSQLYRAKIENNLGDAYRKTHQAQKAIPHLTRALETNQRLLRNNHPDIAMNLNNLANAFHDLAEFAKARSFYASALSIFRHNLGDQHVTVGLMLNNLGNLFIDLKDSLEAKKHLFEAMTIFDEAFSGPHNNKALALNNLGLVYEMENDFLSAEEYFEQALAVREDIFDQTAPLLALSYLNLSHCLAHQNKKSSAMEKLKKAEVICSNHPGLYSQKISQIEKLLD